jgi:hypothetical protein
VLLQLPQLLLQLKEPQPLERAVWKLVQIQEEADAIQKGVAPTARWAAAEAAAVLGAARTALEGVTGSTFDSPAHAREWWNKKENREQFLRERTGR